MFVVSQTAQHGVSSITAQLFNLNFVFGAGSFVDGSGVGSNKALKGPHWCEGKE